MNVAELIQELLSFDQDAEIYITEGEGGVAYPLPNNPFTETERYISKNEKIKVVVIEV